MEVTRLSDADPEVMDGPVQSSTAHVRRGIVGDIGDRVVTVSEVTFRPGERTVMHTHDYGQVLFVTGGTGTVGTHHEEHEVGAGDLVFFPPGEVHWHGTPENATESFSHLTFVVRDEPGTGTTVATDDP